MQRLILLSTTDEKTEKFKEYFKGLNLQVNNACIITTAGKLFQRYFSERYESLYSMLQELGVKSISPFDFDEDNLEELSKFELIFFHGGNPFYLVHTINQRKATSLLHKLYKKGVIIIGSCAGAMSLCNNFELINLLTPEQNTCNLKSFTGVSLENLNLLVHANKASLFKNFEEAINFMTQKNIQIEKLCDGEIIVFENGKKKKIQ